MKFSIVYVLMAWGMLLGAFGVFMINKEIHLVSLLFVITLLILVAMTGLHYRIGEKYERRS